MSSRPPWTGSIAATYSPGVCRPGRTSSRPPWTGSIAATLAWSTLDQSEPVVPSSVDGLHCGMLATICFQIRYVSRPVLRGRAPLRRVDERRQLVEAVQVVPSSVDGLHCGRSSLTSASSAAMVVPSSVDGLHCGDVAQDRLESGALVVPSSVDGLHCGRRVSSSVPCRSGWSSRPPWTGSIAATTGGLAGAAAASSSRPPWTGSIAALVLLQSVPKTLLSSRPPWTGSIAAPSPTRPKRSSSRSSRPPWTGSIAAPPSMCRGQGARTVVPSSVDGLHCGSRAPTTWYHNHPSSRPPWTGSIAAPPPGLGRCRACGRPVLRGRAPLRLAAWCRAACCRCVVPSSVDGLHCGFAAPSTGLTANGHVVPSSVDGLHCGGCSSAVWATAGSGRPVLRGRAPLRLALARRRT